MLDVLAVANPLSTERLRSALVAVESLETHFTGDPTEAVAAATRAAPDCVVISEDEQLRAAALVTALSDAGLGGIPIVALTEGRVLEEGPMTGGAVVTWLPWEAVPHALGVTVRYTSERARWERELADEREAVEVFARAAAHDLKAPLRRIGSFCGLLQGRASEGLDDETRELLQVLSDASDEATDIVDALRRLAASGTGPVEDVDLDEVARQAFHDLSALVEETGATLETVDLPVVPGVREDLVRLFRELIENSLLYRGGGRPVVRISATTDRGAWHVAVEDNGPGIEERYRQRVFAAFQRLCTRSEARGVGLGLTLCRRIVERHGGRIWVGAAPGGGGLVGFTLASRQDVAGGSPDAVRGFPVTPAPLLEDAVNAGGISSSTTDVPYRN